MLTSSINVSSGQEKEAVLVNCSEARNPGQGLTNPDCVIPYHFGSICHPPDNQKQNIDSRILPKSWICQMIHNVFVTISSNIFGA